MLQSFSKNLLPKGRQRNLPPLKLEVRRIQGLPGRLILGAMQFVQIRMSDGLLHAESTQRVPAQHLPKDVYRRFWHRLEDLWKALGRMDRQRLDKFPTLLVRNLHELLRIRGAEKVDDHVQLVLSTLPWKKRPAGRHLSQNAADRPNVDRTRVVCPRAQHLWSTIPTRADVLCHGTDPLLVGEAHSGQAKVADLEVAVAIHQKVSWFQVPVNDLS
mmetsp:Transcript_13982/g.33355  ORF Transcript_13982/g.33355 Transcript_13982/m.33355 type:complete len:215 (+) Transcript_13982:210-854(+)